MANGPKFKIRGFLIKKYKTCLVLAKKRKQNKNGDFLNLQKILPRLLEGPLERLIQGTKNLKTSDLRNDPENILAAS